MIDLATDIAIDTGYTGHEASIKAELVQLAVDAGAKLAPNVIWFTQIGKKSGAHRRAIEVYRGKRPADGSTAPHVSGDHAFGIGGLALEVTLRLLEVT